MKGDDRVRACAWCQKNVYNLSNLTRPEAVALVASAIGPEATQPGICVRFFRRADGPVLTQDCPVGPTKWKRRIGYAVTGVAAVLTLAASLALRFKGTPWARPTPPQSDAEQGLMVLWRASSAPRPPGPPSGRT